MKPLMYKGQRVQGYWVDEDGNVWSYKRGGGRNAHILPANISGKSKYPNVCFRHEGRSVTAAIHRLVAESSIKRPRPKEFRSEIWNILNDREKDLVYQAYEVNHIDHDVTNYHPLNLEWVSRKTNIKKRNDHYSYMN